MLCRTQPNRIARAREHQLLNATLTRPTTFTTHKINMFHDVLAFSSTRHAVRLISLKPLDGPTRTRARAQISHYKFLAVLQHSPCCRTTEITRNPTHAPRRMSAEHVSVSVNYPRPHTYTHTHKHVNALAAVCWRTRRF